MKMQEGLYSDGSEDSELEVWDESAVAAVETSIRLQKKRDQESVTQWGSNYFRPGTAPEVERMVPNSPTNNVVPKKTALSSPPTSLSEVNFALRSAARQAQKHKSSSRPPSGARGTPDSTTKASRSSAEKKERSMSRSGSSAEQRGVYPSSKAVRSEATTSPSNTGVQWNDATASGRGQDEQSLNHQDSRAFAGTQEGMRKNLRSASRKSENISRQERKPGGLAVAEGSPQGRPPAKPTSPASGSNGDNASKQRKAASARLTRPELPISALYSQVYQEEGAPVPQSHPQMFFQKRTRPPSRHRSPQDSLGLDVQPQPMPPRMRSAHYPSHHERPPSRCKPPPEALHLEDASDEEASVSRPSSSRSRRGPTPRPDQSPLQTAKRPPRNDAVKRPNSGTPSRAATQGEFDCPTPVPQTPEPTGYASSEEDVRYGAASRSPGESSRSQIVSVRPPAPASKKKPSITSVPFRTSLSPDFLRLFAPSGSGAPPTPPQSQMVFNSHRNVKDSELFADCMSMGLSDIPSPTDDLFGPISDKELFSNSFEDLCISDDDSEQSV